MRGSNKGFVFGLKQVKAGEIWPKTTNPKGAHQSGSKTTRNA